MSWLRLKFKVDWRNSIVIFYKESKKCDLRVKIKLTRTIQ